MIVTFYSFKGGVGRTHSLLEVAARLARDHGLDVLVWDLDLKAPGMQMTPDLAPLAERVEYGTIDLLLDFQRGALGGEGRKTGERFTIEEGEHEGRKAFPKLDRKLGVIPSRGRKAVVAFSDDELPAGLDGARGRVEFIFPGRYPDGYAQKFGAVHWDLMWSPKESLGLGFLGLIAERLQDAYDIVLIDSRTGYTPMSAACTLTLPDLVVLVFTLNHQNLSGAQQIVSRLEELRTDRLLVLNMVPGLGDELVEPRRTELEERGLRGAYELPLCPELIISERVSGLASRASAAEGSGPERETPPGEAHRREGYDALATAVAKAFDDKRRGDDDERDAERERALRDGDARELERLRRAGIYEKARRFEERVGDIYRLDAFEVVVDYRKNDDQFDLRIERSLGTFGRQYGVVECKDRDTPVSRREVRDFAGKVEALVRAESLPYQGLIVSRSGFSGNAHEEARLKRVQLFTYDRLITSLVDFERNLDAASRGFHDSPIGRLYVEQDVVYEHELRERPVPARPLTEAVLEWLELPGHPLLTLLGDFGVGKTSFCRRIAAELADRWSERPGSCRLPVVVDLARAGSTTVKLENLLSNHFEQLGVGAVNTRALVELNRQGYLLLIFDGFDETIAYAEPDRHAGNLQELLRAAEGRAKVIVTCRTHFFRDRPEVLRQFVGDAAEVSPAAGATRLYDLITERPGTRIGFLREFGKPQIEAFLQRAVPPPADWSVLAEQIRDTHGVGELARTPFLLDLVVRTLPEMASGSGDVQLADLYEAYARRWFERDLRKLRKAHALKNDLVEFLAISIWGEPDARLHYGRLYERAIVFFEDHGVTPQGADREAIDHEVRTALFLNRSPDGYYRFRHRSFLEFFVARRLRRALSALVGIAAHEGEAAPASGDAAAASDPALALAEAAALLDTRPFSREVLYFLHFWETQAAAIPTLARHVLEAEYRSRVSENALLLLHAHAWSAFGPLLGSRRAPAVDEDFGAHADAVRERLLGWLPGRARLSGARLGGHSLAALALRNADLSGASLARAQLRGARLEEIDLSGADLNECALAHATLERVDLGSAVARDADLRGSTWREVDGRHLTAPGADFSDATLDAVDVTGAVLDRTTWQGASLVDVEARASLRAATFVATRLERVSFDGATLDDARFARCEPPAPPLEDAASTRRCAVLDVKPSSAAPASRLPTLTWLPFAGVAGNRYDSTDSGCVLSADGRWAAATSGADVVLFDAARLAPVRVFRGHESLVLSVSLSADGTTLASAGDDKTVRVWDASGGEALAAYAVHLPGNGWIRFDPHRRTPAGTPAPLDWGGGAEAQLGWLIGDLHFPFDAWPPPERGAGPAT